MSQAVVVGWVRSGNHKGQERLPGAVWVFHEDQSEVMKHRALVLMECLACVPWGRGDGQRTSHPGSRTQTSTPYLFLLYSPAGPIVATRVAAATSALTPGFTFDLYSLWPMGSPDPIKPSLPLQDSSK